MQKIGRISVGERSFVVREITLSGGAFQIEAAGVGPCPDLTGATGVVMGADGTKICPTGLIHMNGDAAKRQPVSIHVEIRLESPAGE